MTELKTPDPNAVSFEAGGKTYHLETKISVERKLRIDTILIELAAGVRPSEVFNNLNKLYAMANASKFADIAVQVYKMMEGLKAWQERKDPIMELCAMYINHTDEDRRTISDEQIKAKIADWQGAGISYDFFSLTARVLLSEQTKIWSENFPTSSAPINTEQENEKAQA